MFTGVGDVITPNEAISRRFKCMQLYNNVATSLGSQQNFRTSLKNNENPL